MFKTKREARNVKFFFALRAYVNINVSLIYH